MKKALIRLRNIKESDFRFLYGLLKERDPIANISHKKMPTYSEHVKFVKSKPYTKWNIIEYDNYKVGSIYLSKNDEIGIFLKKKFQGKNIGQKSLQLFMKLNPRKRYLANISPKNRASQKFFKKNGFK
ncbi:MAG: GNAT family N-acetyltransferase, partial [Thermoproteota archaeon]